VSTAGLGRSVQLIKPEADQDLREFVAARGKLISHFARRHKFGFFNTIERARGQQQPCRFDPTIGLERNFD